MKRWLAVIAGLALLATFQGVLSPNSAATTVLNVASATFLAPTTCQAGFELAKPVLPSSRVQAVRESGYVYELEVSGAFTTRGFHTAGGTDLPAVKHWSIGAYPEGGYGLVILTVRLEAPYASQPAPTVTASAALEQVC